MSAFQQLQARATSVYKEMDPMGWAQNQMELSEHHCSKFRDSRGADGPSLDKGILHMESALEVVKELGMPFQHGASCLDLARLYTGKLSGVPAENLERSLDLCKTAFRLMKRAPECPPSLLPRLHSDLADIYAKDALEAGEATKDANKDLAIRYYLAALGYSDHLSITSDPGEWGEVHLKVGQVYGNRVPGSQRGNQKIALKHYAQALQVFTKANKPDFYAQLHAISARAYDKLAELSTTDSEMQNFAEKVIDHCDLALEVVTPTFLEGFWHELNRELSFAYYRRTADNDDSDIEQAIMYGEVALDVYCTGRKFVGDKGKEERGVTSMHLGKLYSKFRDLGSKAENLNIAILHYTMALKCYTKESSPMRWALSHLEIGLGLLHNENPKSAENLTEAKEHLNKALEVYTEEDHPREWLRAHMDLALVYLSGSGVPSKGAKHLIMIMESSAAREATPGIWATAVGNLGNLYQSGILNPDNPDDGYDKAIDCFEKCVDAFRDDKTKSMAVREANAQGMEGMYRKLANVFFQRTRGDEEENQTKGREYNDKASTLAGY